MATLTSETVKAHFAANGIKVRVRDLGRKFRICPVGAGAFPLDIVAAIANALELTSATGMPIVRAAFNGTRELAAYKPGAVIRI